MMSHTFIQISTVKGEYAQRKLDREEYIHPISAKIFQALNLSHYAQLAVCRGRRWWHLIIAFFFLFQDKQRRKLQSTPALLPGKSHGQRSLVGYRLWGRKESDTTGRLHFHSLTTNTLAHFFPVLIFTLYACFLPFMHAFTCHSIYLTILGIIFNI